MRARDPHEPHRSATPLELLYDLCFVVAIAQAAAALHHAIAADHALAGVRAFGVVFFAIWWAWMNFTWFASAFDCDDVPYRLLVLLQMAGVLVLAAGVPRAADHLDVTLMTAGYTIMRIGMVAQWLRARRSAPDHRRTAGRYALGTVLVQLGWLAALWLPPDRWLVAFGVLVPIELLVPAWAERARPTPWHAHHIAERYGLLTLIVLGESVLAATQAVQAAFADGAPCGELLPVAIAAPMILFAMWWLYFVDSHAHLLTSLRAAFAWGYGHLVVFAAAAAVGVGLAVAADRAAQADAVAHGSRFWAGQALSIPVAVFVLALWLLALRGRRLLAPLLLALLAVLAAPLFPWSPLWVALALVLLLTRVVRACA